MNSFDAVVTGLVILAMVLGFMSGLLRSLATMLGYVIAVPVAVAITPRLMPFVAGQREIPPDYAWLAPFVVMIVLGILLGALLRAALGEFTSSEDVSLFDRLAGSAFGAVRIFFVAVLVVVVFDKVIPPARQPPFLIGSRLRPFLSAAGQMGLQSLPPEIDDYIARLKRERGLAP
jgi:membrane protein required for colicin V production